MPPVTMATRCAASSRSWARRRRRLARRAGRLPRPTSRPAGCRCAARGDQPVPAAAVDRHARRRRLRARRRPGAQPPSPPEGLPDAAAATDRAAGLRLQLAARPGRDRRRRRVLVVGPGAIGLLAAQVARAGGGRRGPRHGARRGAARARGRLGFETATTEERRGDAPDVAVECSGGGAGSRPRSSSSRRGGTIVQIGPARRARDVPFDEICFRELRCPQASRPSRPPGGARCSCSPTARPARAADPGAHELADFGTAFARSRAADGVKFVLVP